MEDRREGRRCKQRRLPLLGVAAAAAARSCCGGDARPGPRVGGPSFAAPQAPGRPAVPARDLGPPAAAAAGSGFGQRVGGAPLLRGRPRRQRALPEALSFVSVFLEEVPLRVAELGPFGPIYYFFVYVLAELVGVPASPMTLTAGYLFGAGLGSVVTLLAACTSSSLIFFLTRTFLQPWVEKMAAKNEGYQKINRAVEREGFKIIFLLRLSPLLPFAMSNYFFSLSSVRFRDYLWANMLGFAPATIAYVYVASAARGVISDSAGSPWLVYALGGAATLLLLRQAAQVAKRAVDEAVDVAESRRPASAGA